MEAERWKRIQALFEGARELPEEARSAWLDQQCAAPDGDGTPDGGEPSPRATLRLEVERMLAVEAEAEDHLDGLIFAAARAVPDAALSAAAAGSQQQAVADPAAPPEQIGPYRVVREIGRGGMSTVYLAERADEHYRQQVALKVVRRGPGSGEMLRHLRRERQILAGLDHPNIAKLLDGGNTQEALPYFVMDYVEGEPIDVDFERRELSVRQRLEGFLDICAAVEYAHANLVIHRDIKPNNILVTSGGVPKLLDFGIAKLLEPDDPTVANELTTDLATPTAPGLRLLTPEYASPEQLRGEPLTIATDTYSLGVLLFELLTGTRPFTVDRRQGLELERAILETPPPRPSEAVAGGPPTHGEPSSPANTERRRRRLRGDLDNIVLMALRKEPGRRYASVGSLADDLRRHLDGRPVLARPDTLGYRLGKFVRRNRRGVAAAAAVLALVVTLVVFYTQRLANERDRAVREERESAQVVRLLVETFGAADPDLAQGEELTAREILDQGAARIRAELADQPTLRADLLEHISSIYLRLGLYPRVDPLLDEVERLRRQHLGDDNPKLAAVLHLRGQWLQASDAFDDAEAVHRRGLDLRLRTLGPEHPAVADSLTDLANLFFAAERYDEATQLFRQALALRRTALEPDDPALATSLNDLGSALLRLRQLDTAEPLLREALERRQQRLGDLHPAVAESSSALASVLASQGDYPGALELFRQSLETRKQVFGSDHPIVGLSLNNLGNQLRVAGEPEAAEPLLREAVDLYRRRSAHQDALRKTLGNLAETLRILGRPKEAAEAFRETLDLTRALGYRGSTLWWKLGDCYLAVGDLGAAETAYRELLQERLAAHPPEHRRVASPRVFLARVHLRRGQVTTAQALLEPSVEILRRDLPDHWLTAEALLLFAEVRAQQERVGDARELLATAFELLQAPRDRSASARDHQTRLLRQAEALRKTLESTTAESAALESTTVESAARAS